MASQISTYGENKILDHVLHSSNSFSKPAGVYVKLHLGAPGAAGTTNAAVNATRQQGTFATAAASGSISNTALITWTNVSTTETYTAISLWDASSAGNCLWIGDLTASKAVNAGDTFEFGIGNLTFTLT